MGFPVNTEELDLTVIPALRGRAVTPKDAAHIALEAISNEILKVATFDVSVSQDQNSVTIKIADEPLIKRDASLLAPICGSIAEWLRNATGHDAFQVEGSISGDELEMFEQSGWKIGPLEAKGILESGNTSSAHYDPRKTASIDLGELAHREEVVLTAGPSISPMEISNVDRAVRTGWNSRHSDYIRAFEQELATSINAQYALATSSCTGALHLSLMALGIGPGDEVIVPEITWVASGAAVTYVGATPIFVDIEPKTWNISEHALRSAIGPRTKAIIPVHLYGVPANMDAVAEIAASHGLAIVEDAAPALGATWGGRKVGTFGEFGCFSFQGAKMLVAGEGGMLVTNDEELFLRATKLQDHGRRPGSFWIDEVGIKYKMSNLQAALGLAQVSRLENQIDRKREINSLYRDLLGGAHGIAFQSASAGGFSIDWMTSITLEGQFRNRREELRSHLLAAGIDSRPVFPQMSSFPIWGSNRKYLNPVAEHVSSAGVNLPSGVNLRKHSVKRVAEEILRFLAV